MHSKSHVLEPRKRDSDVTPTIFNLTDHSELPKGSAPTAMPADRRESLSRSGVATKQKLRSTSPTIFNIGEFSSNKDNNKPQPQGPNARPKTAEAKRDTTKQQSLQNSQIEQKSNKAARPDSRSDSRISLNLSSNNFQKSLGSSGSVSPPSKLLGSSSGKKSSVSDKVTNATEKARKRKEVESAVGVNKTGNPNFDVFLEVMQKKLLQITEEKMAAEEEVSNLQQKLQKKDKDLRKEMKDKQGLIRENEDLNKEIALLREEQANLQKEKSNLSVTAKKKSQKEKEDLMKTIQKLQAELDEVKKIKLEASHQQDSSSTPPNEMDYNSEQSSPSSNQQQVYEQRLKELEKQNQQLLEEKLCLTKALSCALQEVHKQRNSEKSQ